jgi:tetratricopeptide (TPR) repeat protein
MHLRHVVLLVAALCVLAPSHARGQQCTAGQGQQFIDAGQYDKAVKAFTCVIAAQPTDVEGYRGRIEARLLLGLYSDALRDYGRVTAVVLPTDPGAATTILEGYAARLSADPQNIAALTGASFARWWLFQYAQAIHLLHQLLAVSPDDVYGNLFRGSSRLLGGKTKAQGVADLERALALAPLSPDVHFIVADAYTYGQPDLQRAFIEATAALDGGLDTPRVHAILGAAQMAFGNLPAALAHIDRHFELITTDIVQTTPIAARDSMLLAMVPGRVYEIPIVAGAGETIAIATKSQDYFDTIAILLAPDGTPVAGSDDTNGYFAAFEWPAAATATYRLRVAFFEAVNTGEILVTRR